MIVLSSITYGQSVKRSGNVFIQDTTSVRKSSIGEKKTKFTYKDKKGVEYPIYITKSGAVYIDRVSSKTGKLYKMYLSKEIKEQIHKELNFKIK